MPNFRLPSKMFNALHILILIQCINIHSLHGIKHLMTFDPIRTQNHQDESFILETREVLHITNEHFLSFALDAAMVNRTNSEELLKNDTFRSLVKNLGPSSLRIGGTSGERIVFDCPPPNANSGAVKDDNDCYTKLTQSSLQKIHSLFNLSPQLWDDVLNFVSSIGWDLMFGFNVMLRKDVEDPKYGGVGIWDPSNALKLINYTKLHAPNINMIWELGNEPNIFMHKYNVSLSPYQLARDYDVFANLKKDGLLYAGGIAGPDANRITNHSKYFLIEFLNASLSTENLRDIDHVTWHHYYEASKTAKLENFTDPMVLDDFAFEVHLLKTQILKKLNVNDKDVWIGEGSSTWSGGLENCSDRYVGGFMYLDKIGICAKSGISLFVRQTIYHGHYAVINQNMEPNPDYWIAIVYNMLVGRRVLKLKSSNHDSLNRNLTVNRKSYLRLHYDRWIEVDKKLDKILDHVNLEHPNNDNKTEESGYTGDTIEREKMVDFNNILRTLPHSDHTFSGETLRVYAHCASIKAPSYRPGDIVIYGMNLRNESAGIKLEQLANINFVATYFLSPGTPNDLQSKSVLLNKQLILELGDDSSLPNIKPSMMPIYNRTIVIPPLTLAFIHIPGIHAKACIDKNIDEEFGSAGYTGSEFSGSVSSGSMFAGSVSSKSNSGSGFSGVTESESSETVLSESSSSGSGSTGSKFSGSGSSRSNSGSGFSEVTESESSGTVLSESSSSGSGSTGSKFSGSGSSESMFAGSGSSRSNSGSGFSGVTQFESSGSVFAEFGSGSYGSGSNEFAYADFESD